jgi:uncharacterized RDD family membrane protein YckC
LILLLIVSESVTMLSSANYGPQRKTNRLIHVCSQCGAVSNQEVDVCPFCETPFGTPQPSSRASHPSAEEPEWRREVARRLEVYRSRRSDKAPQESQSVLAFGGENPPGVITTAVAPRTIARIRPTQHVEIHVSQPQLDFSVVETSRLHPAASSLPVAELAQRRLAGLLDAIAVLGVFAGFLAMFRSLGGQLEFVKINFAIYAAIFFLIYVLYFGLFTTFSGATLGMQIRGISVVGMDGAFPDTRQLLWRSFGYFLSGGTLFLGFLWALWDEDHLTWQDRISHTYITSAPPEDHSADS